VFWAWVPDRHFEPGFFGDAVSDVAVMIGRTDYAGLHRGRQVHQVIFLRIK
jgi:hypothetical protein